MGILEFQKKRRNTALTVRLTEETVAKLKEIAAKHDVSQADVIERLIEMGHDEMRPPSKAKRGKLKST